MANRKFNDFGLYPVVGYVLLLIAFIGFSFFLFYQIKFAEYIYVCIPVYLSFQLSEIRRNDFLKRCFGEKKYQIIRIIENWIVSFPFVVFLLYKHCFLISAIGLVIVSLSSLLNTKTGFSFAIPTPFYKQPFEFTTGFRRTFYLFIVCYLLTSIAIVVDNFNLGIFALMLIYLTTWSYYLKPENTYYVWVYSLSPLQFMIQKMKTALLYSSMLALPVILFLGALYVENAGVLLICFLLGYAFLVLMISAKYAAYPDEINIPQAVLILICFCFPPLLIAVIPFLFSQSIKQLNCILK
jgi:hypothetical protein